jgi:hypothetical protein
VRAPNEANTELRISHNWDLHKLAKTLAWAVLIESLSDEHEKLSQLEGFGMALRDYSEELERIRASMDDFEVESEQKRRKPKKRTKAA